MPEKTYDSKSSGLTGVSDFLSQYAGGNRWCILMEHEGRFHLYERVNNPCMGDLRKYKTQKFVLSSQGSEYPKRVYESRGEEVLETRPKLRGHDDYTDPYTGNPSEPSDDYYPTDLPYPFPLGNPVALGVSLNCGDPEIRKVLLDQKESPFRRGLDPDGKIEDLGKGVVMDGLELDPTVLVNLLNTAGWSSQKEVYYPIIKELPMFDKLFMSYFGLFGGDGYYTPKSIDPKKFFSGESNDLTGGTLAKRYDYNRRILHEVFGDVDIDVKARTGSASKRLKKTKGCFKPYPPVDLSGKSQTSKENLQKIKDYLEKIKEIKEK